MKRISGNEESSMSDNLTHIFDQRPVQAKCEAREEGCPWEFYVNIYCTDYDDTGNLKVRIEFEQRLTASGETLAHVAFIVLPAGNYLIDLRAKTYKVLQSEGEIGFDLASMFPALKVIQVVHEEPDAHLFLITADLKPE
jgi:hypothetical protein